MTPGLCGPGKDFCVIPTHHRQDNTNFHLGSRKLGVTILRSPYYNDASFRQDGYYPDFNPDDYYDQGQELDTIAQLVGSSDLAAEYIQENSVYLARGHLAPNSDFIYYSQQVRCLNGPSELENLPSPSLGFHILLLQCCPSMGALQR